MIRDRKIDLYVIDLSKYDFQFFIYLLDDNEITKANQFLLPGLRESFILRKAFLRLILADYINIHPQKIKIYHSETGKPFIDHKYKIHFNTSSRDNHVVIALSANPVGIDIEKPSFTYSEILALSARFFSKAESEKIKTCTPADAKELFLRFWTAKEAIAKLKGESISDYIEMDVLNKDFLAKNNLQIAHLEAAPGCMASLASNQEISKIKQQNINLLKVVETSNWSIRNPSNPPKSSN